MSGRPSENSRLSSAMKDRYWSKTFAMRCGQPARTLPANQTAQHDMQCICSKTQCLGKVAATRYSTLIDMGQQCGEESHSFVLHAS